MNYKLNKTALTLVFSALLPLTSYGQVTTLVSDTFGLNGDTRVAGAPLAGTSPETGTGTYGLGGSGGQDAFFGTGGGLVPGSTPSIDMGFLGGFIGITPPANTPLSASLTINFGGSNDGNLIEEFAFVSPNSDANGISTVIDPTGGVQLFAGGLHNIGTFHIAGFNSSADYTLTLNLDVVADTASVEINGTQVIGTTSLGAFNIGNNITGVQFFAPNGAPSTALINGLSVEAVPEPSSVTLLMAGLVFAGVVALKRRSSSMV